MQIATFRHTCEESRPSKSAQLQATRTRACATKSEHVYVISGCGFARRLSSKQQAHEVAALLQHQEQRIFFSRQSGRPCAACPYLFEQRQGLQRQILVDADYLKHHHRLHRRSSSVVVRGDNESSSSRRFTSCECSAFRECDLQAHDVARQPGDRSDNNSSNGRVAVGSKIYPAVVLPRASGVARPCACLLAAQ